MVSFFLFDIFAENITFLIYIPLCSSLQEKIALNHSRIRTEVDFILIHIFYSSIPVIFLQAASCAYFYKD